MLSGSRRKIEPERTRNSNLESPQVIEPGQNSFNSIRGLGDTRQLCALPAVVDQRRTFRYLTQQFLRPIIHTDTGLESLSQRDFLDLAKEKRAFYHATETPLREGWWSSLLRTDFLRSPESREFKRFLRERCKKGVVAEIGPGVQLGRHTALFRNEFGARHYLSVDLNRESEKWGAIYSDALTFFSLMPSNSVDVIAAFGVFNEPMSMKFPALNPPYFFLPARRPELATRAHCEHEYVRRLGREMFRVLKSGGILFGDGLHSRGFETEVKTYLLKAGFEPHQQGLSTLDKVDKRRFSIRDPYFLGRDVN